MALAIENGCAGMSSILSLFILICLYLFMISSSFPVDVLPTRSWHPEPHTVSLAMVSTTRPHCISACLPRDTSCRADDRVPFGLSSRFLPFRDSGRPFFPESTGGPVPRLNWWTTGPQSTNESSLGAAPASLVFTPREPSAFRVWPPTW